MDKPFHAVALRAVTSHAETEPEAPRLGDRRSISFRANTSKDVRGVTDRNAHVERRKHAGRHGCALTTGLRARETPGLLS